VSGFPIPALDQVPGFLTTQAAWLLDDLGRHQAAAGIRGDIAEIGVFYGRSALVLGRTLVTGERLVACDRFDLGWDAVPGWDFAPSGPPEEALRRRWAEWVGDPDCLVVVRRDSAELSPADLGAPVRLVHVDGGHDEEVVRRDARLADDAIAGDGAVVFDDVLLPEWPDVTVAVADHLRAAEGGLVPILVAEHKAVACRSGHEPWYREWARRAAARIYPTPRHLVAERRFVGYPVLVASRLEWRNTP
jgi:hypothetical protein